VSAGGDKWLAALVAVKYQSRQQRMPRKPYKTRASRRPEGSKN